MNSQLKIIIRNLRKKPIYSLITFVGFTFGIAAGMLIYLWVFNELNFDKFHPEYESIYRVLTLSKKENELIKSPNCYPAVAQSLKTSYPQIVLATYVSFSSEDSPLRTESGDEKIEARKCFSNKDFFKIFQGFRFVEGKPENAFTEANSIVLSEKIAKKLFGNQFALGKTIVSDKYGKEIYSVSGVVSIPENSHFDFGFIISGENSIIGDFANSWSDKGWTNVYVKLDKKAEITNSFLKQVTNHLSHNSSIKDKLLFQPIADIHLHSDYESFLDKNLSSYKYVWIFSGLALLIIFMAAFNFSLLSVARSSERSTEIAIKKMNGASRYSIIKQFMGESLIQTFVASFLAVILIWLFLPYFSNLSGKVLHFSFSPQFLINLVLLTFGTGVVAGAYPSLSLSLQNPNSIFKGEYISGSRIGFIHLLVAVQFSITIIFIISTTLFIKQLNYVRTKDLGLNHQNIVVIPTGLWYENKGFKEELLKNPSILSVSASIYAPIDFIWKTILEVKHQEKVDSLNVSQFWVDEDFAKTYSLEVIKGQFLKMDYSAYWKQKEDVRKNENEGRKKLESNPVVINETAEKMIGFSDPIGQKIGNNVIVGVVKDFHFRPLRYEIGPLILSNNPENIMTMNIKISPNNMTETIKFIRDVYGKYRGQRALSYNFFDDLLNEKYREETQLKNITTSFSILAIMISVLGILGMAVISINHRIKEIGIRKVNGARVSEVLIMLNKDFARWVVISFVVATPISYYAMHKWLENFAYKTGLSWWIFALAGIMALGIALLTVSWQSWRAATRNPVEALRYE